MSIFTNNRWMGIITLFLITVNIFTLVLLWSNKERKSGDDKLPPPQAQVFEFINQELNLDSLQQIATTALAGQYPTSQGKVF